MIWITPLGAGVTPDSIAYFGGARSLAEGKGFSINDKPITHYPPMYSVFLAASSLVEKDLVQTARFLNATLFGLNVGLVAAVIFFTTGRRFLITILAVIFIMTTTPLIEIHIAAGSEPLFIAFFLVGTICLSMYFVKPTPSSLIGSPLCFGLLSITRYVGAFFLPLAWIVVFFLSYRRANQRQANRLKDALIWFWISLLPLGLLMIRNSVTTGSSTGRSLLFHPVSPSIYGFSVFKTLIGFITPAPILSGMKPVFLNIFMVVLAILLIIFFIVFLKRNVTNFDWLSLDFLIGALCLLFSVNYLLAIFFSKTFIDASTPVDVRILAPVFLPLVIWVFSTIWVISHTLEKPAVLWLFLLLIVFLLYSKIPSSIHSIIEFQHEGYYYTSRKWLESRTIEFVKSVPDDVRIYSNAPDSIRFLAERESQMMPYKVDYTTRVKNPRYNIEMEAMCDNVTSDVNCT